MGSVIKNVLIGVVLVALVVGLFAFGSPYLIGKFAIIAVVRGIIYAARNR
jgi:hypothetical protein